MEVATEELLEEYNKLQEKLVGMQDTIKVRLAADMRIEEENREKTKYKYVVTGKSVSWVPRTHELEVKNRPGQTAEEHNIMSRLNKLFDSEISAWSYNAKLVMVECS